MRKIKKDSILNLPNKTELINHLIENEKLTKEKAVLVYFILSKISDRSNFLIQSSLVKESDFNDVKNTIIDEYSKNILDIFNFIKMEDINIGNMSILSNELNKTFNIKEQTNLGFLYNKARDLLSQKDISQELAKNDFIISNALKKDVGDKCRSFAEELLFKIEIGDLPSKILKDLYTTYKIGQYQDLSKSRDGLVLNQVEIKHVEQLIEIGYPDKINDSNEWQKYYLTLPKNGSYFLVESPLMKDKISPEIKSSDIVHSTLNSAIDCAKKYYSERQVKIANNIKSANEYKIKPDTSTTLDTTIIDTIEKKLKSKIKDVDLKLTQINDKILVSIGKGANFVFAHGENVNNFVKNVLIKIEEINKDYHQTLKQEVQSKPYDNQTQPCFNF